MKKDFNITGTCRPNEHYMMDDSRRFAAIMDFVERGKYFVINRPRQYGKTTMLFALLRALGKREDYLPIKMNFQGISQSHYESSDAFAQFFFKELKGELQRANGEFSEAQMQTIAPIQTLDDLSERITQIVKMTAKRLVLLIDEVDASSNYELFWFYWECYAPSF
jgi:predicted AAA+ superfamily ATPase